MSAEQTPDIERVLAGHEGYVWQRSAGGWTCRCAAPLTAPGEPSGEWDAKPAWRAHVAQALAPFLAAAVREAKAEALREAADDWGRDSPVTRWLRDRADRVAEPQHEAATSGKESEEE